MPKQRSPKSFCKCLMHVWIFIHAVIDHIINFCFSCFYDDSKRIQIPTVKESFLMESAVSLAERIRNKEVNLFPLTLVLVVYTRMLWIWYFDWPYAINIFTGS
jgi:hypothetical protein